MARSSASRWDCSMADITLEPGGRMPHCRAMELPVVLLSPAGRAGWRAASETPHLTAREELGQQGQNRPTSRLGG